jgi:hypothetical protein
MIVMAAHHATEATNNASKGRGNAIINTVVVSVRLMAK